MDRLLIASNINKFQCRLNVYYIYNLQRLLDYNHYFPIMEQEQNQKDNPKDKPMDSATNIMNPEIEESKKTQIKAVVVHQKITMQPVGVTIKVDCNPVARYNHAVVGCYNINRINGIEQLSTIYCPFIVSWVYDVVIYFYTLFFLTITCQNSNEWGLGITLVLLIIYVCILILPIISIITLVISGIFFLYYIAGLVVYRVNVNRLGGHQFTQNMVQAKNAPPFQGSVNQFFQVSSVQTINYYQSNNMWDFYQKISTKYQRQFMAYKPQFLQRNYYYIRSVKMICFHIAFMTIAIIGLVVSTKVFPSSYGM